jgi:hypothetical protein
MVLPYARPSTAQSHVSSCLSKLEIHPTKPGDKTTLIAILASCGALLAMIIGLGIYATHHRKPYHENQVSHAHQPGPSPSSSRVFTSEEVRVMP